MAQDWDDVGAVAPSALGEARIQAHHAAQWAARAARANLTPMPDDSQTNLGWDRGHRALVSHDLPIRTDAPLRVGLQIETMTLMVLRGATVAEPFALDGHRHDEAGAWLDRIAAADGLALPGGESLPYAIPTHAVGSGAPYATATQGAAFAALAHWFAAADDILGEIRAGLPQGEASPVRCWPHHFDLATLWTLGDGDAESAPSVGIGMCPGDGYYPQPYFYISPWPRPAPEQLPPLPAPGHWHTADFIGAILTGDTIVAMSDRRAGTRQFLDAAIAAARGLVEKP